MLSIIVPVHNSEQYLRECVESLVSQSLNDVEILLIDNNSTDSSLGICREYEQKYNKVRLLEESKPGAAAARNRGLKAAKGEYVTFVDSDDYIDKDSYSIIFEIIKQYDTDMICYSFSYVDYKGAPLNWYSSSLKCDNDNVIMTGKGVAKLFLTTKDVEGFSWNKVFKRSIFLENGLEFDENKTAYEDMAVIFRAICHCKTAVLIPNKLYFYRQIESSLTHSFYDKSQEEYDDAIEMIVKIAREHELNWQTEVFLASRDIMNLYSISKTQAVSISKQRILKDLWWVLLHYKSEKMRTIGKGLVLLMS